MGCLSGYGTGVDRRARWGNVITGARRWWVPGLVVVVLAALVIVPRAIAAQWSDYRAITTPTTIHFAGAEITVGPGWELSRTATNLDQHVVLRLDELMLAASGVVFRSDPTVDEAWDGYERVLMAQSRDGHRVSVGAPEPFATADGHKALAAPLTVGSDTGMAFLFMSDGYRAVEGTVLGPAGHDAARTEAWSAVESIRITEDDQ